MIRPGIRPDRLTRQRDDLRRELLRASHRPRRIGSANQVLDACFSDSPGVKWSQVQILSARHCQPDTVTQTAHPVHGSDIGWSRTRSSRCRHVAKTGPKGVDTAKQGGHVRVSDLHVLDAVERLFTRPCPFTHQRSAVRYRPRPNRNQPGQRGFSRSPGVIGQHYQAPSVPRMSQREASAEQ
jgi:hypothetical protein